MHDRIVIKYFFYLQFNVDYNQHLVAVEYEELWVLNYTHTQYSTDNTMLIKTKTNNTDRTIKNQSIRHRD